VVSVAFGSAAFFGAFTCAGFADVLSFLGWCVWAIVNKPRVISKPDSNTTFFIGMYIFSVKWILSALPTGFERSGLPIDFDSVKVFKCAAREKF
jgi:hypothetical protein